MNGSNDDNLLSSTTTTSDHSENKAGERAGSLATQIEESMDVQKLEEDKRSGVQKRRILLGVTGSVATIKLLPLLELLKTFAEVQVVATQHSETFFAASSIPSQFRVYTDQDEWSKWKKIPDPVLHIELRRWADLFLIAPLSANSLAKLAFGLSDNLLTCVARAWDFNKPLVLAPAMNTMMWDNPHTARHLKLVQELSANVHIIPPISKKLACGDIGTGAMASVEDIANYVKKLLIV
eukprot:TRINITY_DN2902_c0_g1_i4.p1 TRINITY_DN2902_c0_g1~~TRINITY_DN2902_c0_g1_i4.p1  ORF type:complete len:272 (+),score=50.72 TRINITY_DN2902_c0_g1_i4:107-817(+)